MRIAVLNGPNLNLLGEREPELYGRATLADIEAATHREAVALGVEVVWTQTNHEGELVEAIQRLRGSADGALVNAAAFTHTSLAVRDALLAVRVPFVEVHLSNIFAREPARRQSLLADIAWGVVSGFGADSYRLALDGLVRRLRAARHAALAALLGAEELDALLVTSLANIRYLTGFSGSAGLLLAHSGDLLLVTDFRYQEQAEAEVDGAARVVVERTSAWERLFREAGGGPLGTIGYEAHALSAKDAERLGVLGKGWHWRAAPELVERLRIRKSAAEVAAVHAAAQLAAQALATTLARVRVGQTEGEIAGALEAELRRLGSESHPFPTIVASGPRTAWPHARTSGRAVARGEWLLLDFGAQVDGYCADITRTVLVGARATDAQRTLYELVHTAQRTAREGIRAGMPARDADALARDLIEARGFGDAFGHSLGHGLGLEVHEAPRLARTNAEPLPVDAVVTVEPGIYLAGQGGVRLEDDVHVAASGPVLLSDGATDLLELC